MKRWLSLPAAVLFALATIGVAPVAASGPPNDAWVYNATTKHFYVQVDGVTWADAEALGVRLGGHLVTVDNQAEQDWLMATFQQDWLWIGLNDVGHTGRWVWSSGTRVTYQNWGDGEPDNWKGYDPLGEHAATLTYPGTPQWADISGRWLGSGIIEVPGKPRSLAGNTLPSGSHDGTTDDPAFGDACYASGWAFDWDSPSRDVTVRVLAMRLDVPQVPMVVWQGPANEFRQDLLDEHIGNGTAAFAVDLRPLIAYGAEYEIRTQGRDVQTGEWANLDGTPRHLTCWP